jgi:hypothetical protein
MSKKIIEDLLGQYWELAFKEGSTGVSQGDKANEVLYSIMTHVTQLSDSEKEQGPFSDVTQAVTKCIIETEKLLCEKLGRKWQPAGMSISTLVEELDQRQYKSLTRDEVETLFWPWHEKTEYKIPLFEYRAVFQDFDDALRKKDNTVPTELKENLRHLRTGELVADIYRFIG